MKLSQIKNAPRKYYIDHNFLIMWIYMFYT